LCYKTTLKKLISVDLSDQFDSGTYTGNVAKLFCAPADKNGEGISDPQTHLLSYKIKGLHVGRTAVEVLDQFGTYVYDTKKTDSLMVPTAKSIAPDPPPGPPNPASLVDHYRCLKVKTSAGAPNFPKDKSVQVVDQFGGARTFFVKKPSRLCLPVDKNGEGIKNPAMHLMCYKGKTSVRTSAVGVQINNQFGADTIALKKEAELCLPARKNPRKVNPGDPVLAPAAGYVGSPTCMECHEQKYWGWIETLHRLPIRDTDEPGRTGKAIVADSDGDGTDDFKEGTNLGTAPNATPFAVYGSNAPVLGFDPGRMDPNSGAMGVYTITIGPITYDITRTHGGNGYWKQRYQTRIGNSYYYLPVQYNEATNNYVVYNGGDWYDGSNNPRYTNPATLETDIDKSRSYERNCAGCHNTGVDLEVDGAGQWVTGYVELGIGCEDCHGPGEAHAASMDPADIINPGKFGPCDGDLVAGDGNKDGTCRESGAPCDAVDLPFPANSPDCLASANEVCGQCHGRGTSTLVMSGKTLGYPAKDDGAGGFQGFVPGNILAEFYAFTTSTGDYWGLNQVFGGEGHTVPSSPNSYVASKSHHQQYLDWLISPHAPDNFYDPTCFSCHDAHGSGNEHNIVESLEEDGVDIPTKVDDNSLCLACHATHGPFAGVTKEQVAEIGSGTTPPEIVNAVLDHMAEEAGMGGAYDPLGSGVGRCTSCHLPQLAKSAVGGTDAEGHTTGDVTTHTFTIIWPSVNERLTGSDKNVSNSCTGCHSTGSPLGMDEELFQWAKSGHADLTARHWRYAAGEERAACVRCHSGNGFVDFLAGIPEADRRTEPKMVTCYACHDGTPGDLHPVRAVASVTFPSGSVITAGGEAKICMNCHQGRQSKSSVDTYLLTHPNPSPINFGSVNPHYFAAAAVFFGSSVSGMYQYDGKTYLGESPHRPFKGYCLDCHLSETPGSDDVGGHTMAMVADGQENTAGCGCHASQAGLDAYRNPFGGAVDYDGDGNTSEGIKGEIETMMADLMAALNAAGITCTDAYPYCSGWNGTTEQQKSQLKAAYNYRFLKTEHGAYAHNGLYALQILHDSYADLTGGPHAGVRP